MMRRRYPDLYEPPFKKASDFLFGRRGLTLIKKKKLFDDEMPENERNFVASTCRQRGEPASPKGPRKKMNKRKGQPRTTEDLPAIGSFIFICNLHFHLDMN